MWSLDLYQSSSSHGILNPEASSSKVGPVNEGGQSFELVHLQPGTDPVLADDTQGEHNSLPVPQKPGQTKTNITCEAFSDSGTSS